MPLMWISQKDLDARFAEVYKQLTASETAMFQEIAKFGEGRYERLRAFSDELPMGWLGGVNYDIRTDTASLRGVLVALLRHLGLVVRPGGGELVKAARKK
jgi:hypothetical protein